MQHVRGEEAQCTRRKVQADFGLGKADVELSVVTKAKDTSQALQIIPPIPVWEAVHFAFLVDGKGGEARAQRNAPCGW